MSERHVGLTRREMERELRWLLRDTPSDPKALMELLASAFVAIVEKNNAAIAASLDRTDELDEEGF